MTRKKYRKRGMNFIVLRLAVLLFLGALVGGSFYYLIFESYAFRVKSIYVQGYYQVSEQEIIRMSEVQPGDRYFRINLAKVERQITSHPYIRSADVRRKGLGTINIVVRERVEYAIIPYMGSYITLDEDKVVLNVSEGILGNNTSLITGIQLEKFQIGEKAHVQNETALDLAYQILRAANEADILDMISEINIDQNEQVTIVTFNGIEALFGSVKNSAYSVLALKEALITLHTRNMRDVIIDMRFEGHITVQHRVRQEDHDD